MDAKERELERTALLGDCDAQAHLKVLRCRNEGHIKAEGSLRVKVPYLELVAGCRCDTHILWRGMLPIDPGTTTRWNIPELNMAVMCRNNSPFTKGLEFGSPLADWSFSLTFEE